MQKPARSKGGMSNKKAVSFTLTAFIYGRFCKTSRGRMVYANNFCKHYGINPTEPLAFLSPKVNKDGILINDLKEVQSVRKI